MKRSYASVAVAPAEGDFLVTLDGRPLRTPKRRVLSLPSEGLARLVAAEWAEQGDVVRPTAMRVSRLATTAVDLMPDRRSGAIEQVVEYARTDLLCYRASGPADLRAAQARLWDPPLAWLAATHGIALDVTCGVMPGAPCEAAVRQLAAVVGGLADWPLVGLHAATTAAGSIVLGLMVQARALSAAAAGDAALVDERYERARWGEEAEALDRERRLLADLAAAEAYLGALTT